MLGLLLTAALALADDPAPVRRHTFDGLPLRASRPTDLPSLTHIGVRPHGFHFQIVFGLGGGPQLDGLFHAMEIGGTIRPGVTFALLHTFLQNKGILGPDRGPDLIGGWLFETKLMLGRPEVVAKIALGPGGLHHQDHGIQAVWGPTIAWGVDFQLPVSHRSGPTLALTGIVTFVEDQYFYGFGAGLGWVVF